MEVEQPRSANTAMNFDEVFMERSKSFVKAIQELKNLRPQMYSAAEYCETSYLQSAQKQMVLDNLKDYAVRAVVNAVDHLGTVAYKLNDLLEQQTSDISTMEFKISCVHQKLLTCQTYTDKEGLRQQQLLASIPRHHKHYMLPISNSTQLSSLCLDWILHSKLDSVSKRVHFSPNIQKDPTRGQFQARSHLQPSARSLSWHLASETTSTLKTSRSSKKMDDPRFSAKTSGVFQLLDEEERTQMNSVPSRMQLTGLVPASGAAMHALGTTRKEVSDGSRTLTSFGSSDNENRLETAHVRSKSVLSAFFVKQKVPKPKAGSVS